MARRKGPTPQRPAKQEPAAQQHTPPPAHGEATRRFLNRGVQVEIRETADRVALTLDGVPIDVTVDKGEYFADVAHMFTGFGSIDALVDHLLANEGRTWTLHGHLCDERCASGGGHHHGHGAGGHHGHGPDHGHHQHGHAHGGADHTHGHSGAHGGPPHTGSHTHTHEHTHDAEGDHEHEHAGDVESDQASGGGATGADQTVRRPAPGDRRTGQAGNPGKRAERSKRRGGS